MADHYQLRTENQELKLVCNLICENQKLSPVSRFGQGSAHPPPS